VKTFICSMLIIMSVWVGFAADKIDEVYNSILSMSKKITPASYRVRVKNKTFEDALKDLPEDVLTGKGKPAVVVTFKKGVGVKIIIENIKSEYASLFSMYEDYLKFSGISKVQNPVEFKELIDRNKVSFVKEDPDSVVVQAWDPGKEEKDNNYALFTIDKKMWVILKAVYYLDGSPYVQVINSYKNFGKYYLPYKIELKNLVDGTSDLFLFEDYRFGG